MISILKRLVTIFIVVFLTAPLDTNAATPETETSQTEVAEEQQSSEMKIGDVKDIDNHMMKAGVFMGSFMFLIVIIALSRASWKKKFE